jgi:CDP-diacylglycerol--glycerol-3-phosphate 3-phosphatidyltransferase
MKWTLPNQLTVGRLLLAGVFFALLAMYELPTGGSHLLNVCFVLYVVAGVTDMLDGYLARKMDLTTVFGRITDPFVDKVLVCGTFALLTGSNFSFAHDGGLVGSFESSLPPWLTGNMASGVQAWMVVAVVAREFIVSAVRGYSEARGRKFHATIWGKLKMSTQSTAICVVLFQLANLPNVTWAIVLKLSLVWLSVVVTVVSGLAYVNAARHLLASEMGPSAGDGED